MNAAIPKGFEFVQYELDDNKGHATLTYEHRDGRAVLVTRDERTPGLGDPRRKAWSDTVLSRRNRAEMMLDGLFVNLHRA